MVYYSFLQNFTSLLEVFTAIYVSMFLDEILVNIWTPNYKEKIGQLIKDMNIPAISYFVIKVESNIDKNAEEIRGHMKRKAVFFFVYCMSLLLLAGLETNSQVLPQYGYMIVTLLSSLTFLFILFGRWMFSKYSMVVVSVMIYAVALCLLYFTPIAGYLYAFPFLQSINDKIATCSFLIAIVTSVLWQLFLIWVYYNLYKGFMQEKISKEAYVYGKAYIAYRIKDMAALPKEYEVVARDFVAVSAQEEEDTSLNSLNTILVRRLEILCEPPNVIKVFWSWIKYNLRGRHNPEAEYIEQNGFDYDAILINNTICADTSEADDAANQTSFNDVYSTIRNYVKFKWRNLRSILRDETF